MSNMMRDAVKTATTDVEAVRDGTARRIADGFAAAVKGVNAISGIVAMLRSLDRDDGLAWLGLARRRPLRSAGVFGAGLVLGVGLGVLLAPMSGAQMRKVVLARLGATPKTAKDAESVEARGARIAPVAAPSNGASTTPVETAKPGASISA